ncbi:MAG: type II secretion system secretin GspD [Deltaproteobacteria bacterium]|nr:type II secretion system secretin GspD [Deltaproteobacteria bacterium]
MNTKPLLHRFPPLLAALVFFFFTGCTATHSSPQQGNPFEATDPTPTKAEQTKKLPQDKTKADITAQEIDRQPSPSTPEPQPPAADQAPAGTEAKPAPPVKAQPAPEQPKISPEPAKKEAKAPEPKEINPNPSLDPAAAPKGIQQNDGGLVLNFEHAELSEVIMAFAGLLNLNYMVVADLKGHVTIQTSGALNKADLFPLFYQILEANGLTAVQEGNLYKIVALKDAPRALSNIRKDSIQSIPVAERGVQIQIVPLKYISTTEMIKLITPFISAEGSIISHDASRTLLIVDQRANLQKALRLIETFDVDLFANIKHHFFQLQYMESKDIIGPLSKLIELYNKNALEEFQVFSLDKINSLLVITPSERLFAKTEEVIADLDKPSQEAEPHIYIYFLKNSQAKDMYGLLTSIFTTAKQEELSTLNEQREGGGKDKDSTVKAGPNPFAQKTEPPAPVAATKIVTPDFGTGTLRGEIKINQDEIRNALIIEATPSDYRIIEKVLERLDILPRQVLISLSIVEVQLGDDLDLGVEWEWQKVNNAQEDNPSSWEAATGSTGLSYIIGQADKWKATLNALASKKKINILSSPSVLASDNKKAQIAIATEIPVASSQIQYDNTVSDKTQTDIQYRNTGVLLGVTPHINEYGLVSMDINQEVSEVADAVDVGGKKFPSFFKRSVNTSLTVDDGQTIVIGGLIRENISNTSSGVPFLSDIPGLGWLFSNKGDHDTKSELIILITPRVVASLEDVDAVTSEFSKKVGYDPKK